MIKTRPVGRDGEPMEMKATPIERRKEQRRAASPPPPSEPASSDIKSITSRLGTRLEKAAPLLALQPTSLQDLLIPELRAMLSLYSNIGQRVETFDKQSKPMVDPKSKKTIKMIKYPEQDLPFIPSSLWRACPIKSSDALKDDPGIKQLLDEAASDWEHFAKVRMAMHDRAIKEYEIKKRKEQLQHTFVDFAALWAKGIILDMRESDDLPDEGELSWKELALTIAYKALSSFDQPVWETFGFTSKAAMLRAYNKRTKYDARVISAKETEDDRDYYSTIITDFADYLTETTVDIWNEEKKKDVRKKVNAAIIAELGTEQIAEATADVREALDSNGSQSQEQRILDAARKAARTETTKTVQRLITSQRKKSLGSEESQSLSDTNNGRSSNKKSKKSGKQQKQKESQKQPPKSSLKKGKSVKFKATPKGNGKKGSQDGAKGGKKGKGASKR